MQNASEGRLMSLEGLRGVASLVVVIFHGLSMYYPVMLYGLASGAATIQNSRFEDNLYGNPISVAISGAFAVAVFFVLSGFVLTIGFFSSGDFDKIRRIAGKRYLRLMIPALASILLTFLILSFGLGVIKSQVADITGSMWLENLWQVQPSLLNAFNQGIWGVFFNGDVSYNPVLWTMKFELLGSLLVFAVAMLFGKAKYRWVIYLLLIFGTFQTWYFGFVTGMILADLYANRKFPFAHINKGTLVIIVLAGLFLGGYPYTLSSGSVYGALEIPFMNYIQNQSFYLSIAATCIVIAVIGLTRVSKFFAWKPISILGKYSFSMYLTHMAVLFTVGSLVFLALQPHIGFHWAAGVSILSSLIALVPVAYLFERYVDTPAIKMSGLFSNWLFGNETKKK